MQIVAQNEMRECIALVVGAGRGSRFGGDEPKQYALLSGMPVIARTLAAFAKHPLITGVRAVIHPDDRDLYDQALKNFTTEKLLQPVNGGKTRQESVRLGLQSLAGNSPQLVLIHDAARPFVSDDIIERVIESLAQNKGAIAAMPVNDTLKSSADGFVKGNVDRDGLWRAQTPQGFHFDDILQAHMNAANCAEQTDDAAVAEVGGMAVELVAGSEKNVKITTMDDFMQAERMLGGNEHRTGQGFDVHRFCEGSEITLCGVKIPYSNALDGHSDADVAMHALTDALLGAIGEQDIGSHFPPGEAEWKGVASDIFLAKARDLIGEKHATIVNVDITVICEEPKVGPYRAAMTENISRVLAIDETRVSIKATTTERLGFAGRKEGIAAQAIATVKFP